MAHFKKGHYDYFFYGDQSALDYLDGERREAIPCHWVGESKSQEL